MRQLLIGLSLSLVVVAFGCGNNMPTGEANKIYVGTYKVQIMANNKSDTDTMFVSQGANNTILLDFVYGASQVRCLVVSGGKISVLAQSVKVQHSTGIAEGTAGGSGDITPDGELNLSLDISTAATGTGSDAGSIDKVTYTITGTKN